MITQHCERLIVAAFCYRFALPLNERVGFWTNTVRDRKRCYKSVLDETGKNVFLCLFLSLLGGEGSAEAGQKETSTCDICQFGAECDVDAEDVW